jgi:hypothetical protein
MKKRRELIEQARQLGYEPGLTASGHLRFTHPLTRRVVTCSTNTGKRATQNALSDLRRYART